MLIVDKKWFARGLIFLSVLLIALLLATTALAQGPERKGPPGPPPGKGEMPAKHGGMCSSISGMVWYDGNGNMEFDPHRSNPRRGEHPMDGAVVKLYAIPMAGPHMGGPMDAPKDGPMKPAKDGPMRPGPYDGPAKPVYGYGPSRIFIASTTARDGGWYKFDCVPPGTYSLEVIPPPSHVLDKLSIKHNPTPAFELMGGDKIVKSFGFKVWMPFPGGAELNEPTRLNP